MATDDVKQIQLRETLLSFATTEVERAALIEQLARDLAPEELARTLATVAADVPVDVLGYGILPALREWLEREEGRAAAQALAEAGDTPAGLRLVLLDFVDAAARRAKQVDPLWPTLRRVAADKAAPAELRAKAARQLHRDESSATGDLLAELARDRVALVADEAVLAAARSRRPIRADFSQPLSAARLRALVEVGDGDAVRRAADAAASDEERARLLCAAGDLLEPAQQAEIVGAAAAGSELAGVAAVRGFFGARPERLAQLHDAGHVDGFVDAAILLGGGFDTATRERLVAVVGGADDRRAGKAASLLDPGLLPDRLREIRADGRRLIPEAVALFLDENRLSAFNPDDPLRPKGAAYTGGGPFSTGLHLGDALYRDLILPGTHWHAGVYAGFVPGMPTGSDGTLWAINADGAGFSEAIAPIVADRTLGTASANVAAAMADLRADFILAFQEGHFDKTFHGPREPLGITAAQRASVANTAAALQDHNIWWTWADQLDYKWWDWDGTINDIDESRCDGVVEYSYEASGVRVCGGIDPTLFDISVAGKDHPDNHNNFHNGIFPLGELCPRIQAGDATHAPASDTTFVVPTATPPALADVDAFGIIAIFVPSIWFRVVAPAYDVVYVRVTVSLGTGPRHFIVTEDPYGNTTTLLGEWRFHPVPANTQSRLYAWWQGKTNDGTDFAGQDGDYTFRFLAIDRGGNVSAVTSRTVTIKW
jgi:hypothetical protein